MDNTRAAQILFAATGQLSPAGNADALHEARRELAKLIWALDGEGFPSPRLPSERERAGEAWADCTKAASFSEVHDAAGQLQEPTYRWALLWPPDPKDASKPGGSSPDGLSWPFENRPQKSFGPFVLAHQPSTQRSLFFYEIDETRALTKDGSISYGLYPRRAPAVAGQQSRRIWLATFCFAGWFLLGCLALFWLYVAAEYAGTAAGSMQESDATSMAAVRVADTRIAVAQAAAAAAPVGEDGRAAREALTAALDERALKAADACLAPIQTAGVMELSWRPGCDQIWQSSWDSVPKRFSDKETWDKIKRGLWEPTNAAGELSLLWPLIIAATSIVLLVIASGLAGKGMYSGTLIDERNRVSLTRIQQLAWTVVLFGGFTVLGIFNIALLADHVRRLEQGAAATGTSATILGLFPSMDPTLWAVLGIAAVVSPYLSKRILDNKETNEGYRDVEIRPVVAPEELDRRADPRQANWADLFMGESEADKDVVDVSRLQHLVITVLLLGGYVVLLVDYARNLSGRAIMLAAQTGAPVFASMPPVDATFVGLLVLSHGAYLAFKALPASKGAGPK